MIQFPRNLHNLHFFRQNGKQFVADLNAGVVIPVNDIVCDILNACSVSETDAIIEAIADKYGRSEIFEALAFLSKLSKMGLLFSSHPAEMEPTRCNERQKIFLTEGIWRTKRQPLFY